MKITRDDDWGGAVLNCAVRYALGRMSYMPGLVMDVIRPMLRDCSDKTLWCLRSDVSGWLEQNQDDKNLCYQKEWGNFLTDVIDEMNKRAGGKS